MMKRLFTKTIVPKFNLKPNLYTNAKYGFTKNDNQNKKDQNDYSSFDNNQEQTKQEKEETINSSRKIFYVFGTAGVIVSFIYFGLKYFTPQTRKVETIQRTGKVTYVGKAKIGGDWELINAKTGQPFGSNDLKGKYYLIYFGFTKCPDVCPMSMAKIAKVIKDLKTENESKFFDLESIFVSVDPDRDTPERIIKYCSIFDPTIIGITAKGNNDKSLLKMLKDFKIHASKIYLNEEGAKEDNETLKRNSSQVYETMSEYDKPNSNEEKYSMDHTIVTYLFGGDNEFITYLSSNLTSDEMKTLVFDEILADLKVKSSSH